MLKANRVKRAFGRVSWLGAMVFATGIFVSAASAVAPNITANHNSRARLSVDIDTILNVTIPETFNFMIRSDDVLHATEFSFNVTTNHLTGYTAYASVANTDFVKDNSPTDIIPTIPHVTPNRTDDFPVNHWGLGFPEEDPNTFLPATTDMRIESVGTPVQDRSVGMLIGTRINSDVPAGHYNCTITFQVTPNVIPDTIRSIDYLQQMNTEVAASMQEGDSYKLRDSRNNKEYWIVKENGQIYMQQNLDLEFTNEIGEGGTPVYTVLAPVNSDVADERTMLLITPWGTSANEIYYFSGDDKYYPNGYEGPEDIEDMSPLDDIDLIYSAGSYYSWNSATAGSGAAVIAADTAAAESICPAGWRLPLASEANIVGKVGSVRSGHLDTSTGSSIIGIYDGIDEDSGALYLWTAESGANATDAKYIKVTTSSVSVLEGARTEGYSVRCIADATSEFTLTFDANGGTGNTTGYHDIIWEESVDFEISDDVNEIPTKAGKDFLGWATTNDATMPEYIAGESTVTIYPGQPVTLYAVWRTSCAPTAADIVSAVCLQDLNSTIKSTMVTDTQYQLMDYRDGKTYFVAKLADGEVWMTQNLDFAISTTGVTKLIPATSDVTEARELTASDSTAIRYKDNGDIYYASGITSTDASMLLETDPAWHYHAASLYSWDAATAGVGATAGVSTESICPKGWTLPRTGDGTVNKSFAKLTDAYSITDGVHYNVTDTESLAQNSTTLEYKADLNIGSMRSTPIFMPQAGYGTEYGQAILPGKSARYWTADEANENHAYAFSIYEFDSQALLQNLDNENKNANYSVRCVLK